jgi:hypothetical protein
MQLRPVVPCGVVPARRPRLPCAWGVRGEDLGGEIAYSVAQRDLCQLSHQRRCDTAEMLLVGDRDAQFGDLGSSDSA